VLAGLVGGVAVLALTMPAAAFNSGTDPDTYYGDTVNGINLHRVFLGNEGKAFEPADGFTRRMPDDEFDDQILSRVNGYREMMGLGPAQHYEPLRTQSAIWANRMADAGDGFLADPWYSLDARVVCHQLDDIFTVSSFTQAGPQEVFDNWLNDPAVVTGMLTPDPVFLGSATVEAGDRRWVTMRIANGSCPGEANELSAAQPVLPTPVLSLTQGGNDVEVVVERQGMSQLTYEVQVTDGSIWRLARSAFTEPGRRTVIADLQPGVYRVVVPSQSGYGTAISQTVTIG
jgi:hypothetical protein